MKVRSILLIISLLLSIKTASSQNKDTQSLDFYSKSRDKNCEFCVKAFNKKPREVKFSIVRENANLYFQVNDINWFNFLFQNPKDGLAVDIVSKSRYDCTLESVDENEIKGMLLEPVYSEALKKGIKKQEGNLFSVWVGKVPQDLQNKDLEYNIVFLGNKTPCRYNVLYNLDSYSSDLLDMGLFLDDLTFSTNKTTTNNKGYIVKNKTLKFIIPFDKNKSEYSREDIKPIYDSLRLTDFNIKTINIKAYSSIEGITKRNFELQELRAKNIASAIQLFQKPTIKTNVSASENWVEFFNDIEGTPYEGFKSLSKKEVKSKIAGQLSRKMEPIFKKHRKAVLELELEKKDENNNEETGVLLTRFNNAIKDNNINKAIELQNSIFEKIKLNERDINILQNMQIPKQAEYATLLNKNAIYKYMVDFRQGLIVYEDLLQLEKLVPKNAEIKYNITALKIKLWYHKAIDIKDVDLLSEINSLKRYGIDKSLITKMLVNFHMVIADKLMMNRDFDNKEKSVAFINKSYKNFTLTDLDYLNLAQSFSYYAHSDLALELLERKARSIDIDEDLLFYYLNLTLINKELTKEPNYRTVMLNAVNINKKRFCELFNSVDNGGVTFQLLDDKYLRNIYCENCSD